MIGSFGEHRPPECSGELVIRPFRIDDYDAVVALWKDAGLPFRPRGRDARERIALEIERPNALFLVAESAGRLCGSIFGTHDGRKGWINRLAVSPEERRRGVAARLVAEVERRLEGVGIEISACLIETWNQDSMAVFEQLGFQRHPEIVYFTKRKRDDV